MELTPRQRRHLRGLAHHLKPVVHVGASRVTDAVVRKVDEELKHHELIKVKILEAKRPELTQAAETLCARTGAALAQTIGHNLVLYRARKKEPTISLPD